MDRIRMPLSKSREVTVTFREVFQEFVLDATARGLSPKTIRNYEHHFHCVSKHMDVEMPTYRQQETSKETYTDEKLKRLLKPPEKTCRFSIYRTWVIINFLPNNNTEEMEVGTYIIRWTSVLSNRFDSTSFKKVHGDLYKAFTKQVTSRRFSIA